VQSSFSGADFCPDKEEDAGNPLWLFKDDDEVWAKIRPQKPVCIRFLLPIGLYGYFISKTDSLQVEEDKKTRRKNPPRPYLRKLYTPKLTGAHSAPA